jgi:thioredoxin-like negative regulator of GroEL
VAVRAPRLPREYRTDFIGFYTECLIKAVELQLDRMTAEQRAQAVNKAEAEGFVLVRALVQQLERFQQAEPAMTYYFPDLASGVNVPAEIQRLQGVQFAAALEAAPVDPAATDAAEREQLLQQGERLLAAQNGAGAQQVFEKVLARWPGTPRATYGLAIAAVYQGQPDHAKELFTSLTRPAAGDAAGNAVADPIILSWSHVYLGRMSDLKGDREEALGEYRAALAVQGAPEAARLAAQRGVEKAYSRPGPSGDH